MAGAGRVRRSRRLREAPHLRAAAAAGVAPEEWRDWAGGLPAGVLAKVAGKVVAGTEAGWAARLEELQQINPAYWTEERIQEEMTKRKRDGNCLFVFARVCRGWRKAQLRVGGPLRTRVESDVLLPGRVALAKWALAEGCPRSDRSRNMAEVAAEYGHHELVQWLCGEGGFAMEEWVMGWAARSGNLELVQWLRGEGCPWHWQTCFYAIKKGHVEVLRWARENGCPWTDYDRDRAAEKLGYTDNLGNPW